MDLLFALTSRLHALENGNAASDAQAVDTFHELVACGLDQLPLPGQGATYTRWQCLARVAAHDLSLAKLYEGHTDALAILAELSAPIVSPGTSWGVWCAETPGAQVSFHGADKDAEFTHLAPVRLTGKKAWCSGATHLRHALLSVRNDGHLYLAAIDLSTDGISIDAAPWTAVGMAQSSSVDVCFDDVPAILIGRAGAYLTRPGFWHGGAGVAACWYGASAAIAESMRGPHTRATDPHFLAHLGAIEVALRGASATLQRLADTIDRAPGLAAMAAVMQARLQTEDAATAVMMHAGRALGAAPFCRNALFARRMADLPVFLRQSHAERDLASLGTEILNAEEAPWSL